jgi:CMP-N,N'-diacetyllegionaminic acid synthase
MNVLTVIPARGSSKRVPNKNIRPVAGKPLIAYTIEEALKSKLSNKVVVSTDDPRIASLSERYGAETVTRPPELSLDTSPIDDALRHAVRFYENKKHFAADIVVLLQANVPLRKHGEIDAVIKKIRELGDATAVVTCYAVDQRPEWMKTVDPKTGLLEPFMGTTDLYRKQELPGLYLLDGAVLSIKTKTLMVTEGVRRAHGYLGDKIYMVLHDAKYSLEIDVEKDFEMAEYFLLKEER